MASGIVTVTLSRDGPQTPWGFRLHGGKDIGFPMVIQRVFLGSPSESELQRGDTILKVQGQDTANLTHMEAYDIIKAAGTRLQLLIRRLPGAPQPPVTPTSPVPMGGMHPYVKLLRETEAARTAPKAPMFQPMSPPRVTPQPLPTSQPIKEYCYSPLPTTPIPDRTPIGGYFAPTPRTLADSELVEYHHEKAKEKDAIVHQGYRTLPLIAPKPKTRHDIPMGSYLRYVPDSNWKGRSSIQPSKPAFMNKYPTPTYSTIGIDSRRTTRAPPPGAPMFERPLDEGSQLVHHQYNSPLFLYSQRNVDETIKDQTGVPPSRAKLNVNASLPSGQAAPLSPGTLTPAKPGTKLINIVDITLSPTFQMIQEAEKRTNSPQPPQEIRTPTMIRKVATAGPKPFGFEPSMNSFGSSREIIHQSGSFKTLMSQLSAPPEQQA